MNAFDKAAEDIDRHAFVISLVKGKVKGEAHWAYAKIALSRYLDFQQAQLSGKGYNLGDYAQEILAQGQGEAPPLSVQKEMEARGFNQKLGAETGEVIAEALHEEPEILYSFKVQAEKQDLTEDGAPKGTGGGRKGRSAA